MTQKARARSPRVDLRGGWYYSAACFVQTAGSTAPTWPVMRPYASGRRCLSNAKIVVRPSVHMSRLQSAVISSSSQTRRHGDDLALRVDDDRVAEQFAAVLGAGLRRRHREAGVLIAAGLDRQMRVEHPQVMRFEAAGLHVQARRVVAEHHQLDALQPQHAPGFRPAAVVADHHAHVDAGRITPLAPIGARITGKPRLPTSK